MKRPAAGIIKGLICADNTGKIDQPLGDKIDIHAGCDTGSPSDLTLPDPGLRDGKKPDFSKKSGFSVRMKP